MALKTVIKKLVLKYGIRAVLGELENEAARQTICDSNPDAGRIFDVCRACKEELNERHF